jgi:hypothetical protein
MTGMDKLRAWWSHRQGLDGTLTGKSAAEVLESAGWVRGLGGVAPYLALFTRAGISREAADAAAAKLQIHELPAARGCTYIVPAKDFALALQAGAPFEEAEVRVAAKLGVTEKEIDKLCDAVMKALAKGPLEPDAIREATGGASRSLGEAGKKKGVTTTLPLALGRLQATGDIRRVATNGRFDQQRYRYALWKPNAIGKAKLSREEIAVELARRFFTWTGPATIAEFQTFSTLSGKAAKAAMEPLKLVSVGDDRYLTPEHRDEFESFKAPKKPQYSLASVIDGLHLFRGGLDHVIDRRDFAGKELESHPIYDRGKIVGLWEFDPDRNEIAWCAFGGKNKDLAKTVARVEEFVREQLGDARGYALDSHKSRAPRIAALRG